MEVTPGSVMVEIVNGDYKCNPCAAVCNTRVMLDGHMSGKKHLSKIASCGGEALFQPLSELGDLPQRESETLSTVGRKRKNISAQGHFRCDVCEIDFDSAIPYEGHMQGKKHLNKAQKREVGDSPQTAYKCEICSVAAPSKEAYDAHVNGKRHAAKVEKINVGVEPGMHHCEFCDVSAPTLEAFEQHRNGKKHADKVRKIAEGASGTASTLKCDICNITVTSAPLLESHLNGKKHLKASGGVAPGGVAPDGAPKPPPKVAETITCDVCNVSVTCQQLMDTHLLGKKHAKAVAADASKGLEPLTCETCNVSVPSQVLMEAHVQGKKHRYRLSGGIDGPPSLYCNICSLQLNSDKTYDGHLEGKAHQKKALLANQENASAMATSLIQSVRDETGAEEMKQDLSAQQPPPQQPPPQQMLPQQPFQQQQQAVPTTPLMAPSPAPGRLARGKKPNN